MEAMVKRIQLESRGKKPEDVKSLNLDCCRSTQIYGLTEEFKNLESLSLIDTGLTSLKGFPALPNLKKLELSDNRLMNGLEALQGCKKLTQLSLGGNRLKDIASLEPLKALPNLKNLDLFNCEVTTLEDYRKKVYELLPNLDVLDNFDKRSGSVVENNEDEYGSEEEGDSLSEDDDGDDADDDGYNYQLNYLEKSGLENESEGEDFVPGNDLSEDEIDEEDDDDEDGAVAGAEGGGGGDGDDVDGADYDDDDDDDNAEENDSAEVTQASRKRKRPEGGDEEEEEN